MSLVHRGAGDPVPGVAPGRALPRRPARTAPRVFLALVVVAMLAGCRAQAPEAWRAEVVARHPHDPGAFTQGLVWHDGFLFESTGLYGSSSLRRVDLDTGAVEEVRYLSDDVFAEGLARVGDELVQLTWREGIAFRWPLDGFGRGEPERGRHAYRGEGWGLCFDGEHLVMSDGSDRLTLRDPQDFDVVRTVAVTLNGEPLEALNELECVDGYVWANVWHQDDIVRIDPADGVVDATVDLTGLLSTSERAALADGAVLNGIAWRPETATLLVTGKLWPVLFEIRIVD